MPFKRKQNLFRQNDAIKDRDTKRGILFFVSALCLLNPLSEVACQYQYTDPTSSTGSTLSHNSLYSGFSTTKNGRLYSATPAQATYNNAPTGGGGGYSNFASIGADNSMVKTYRPSNTSLQNNAYDGRGMGGFNTPQSNTGNSQSSSQLMEILGFLRSRPKVQTIVNQALASGDKTKIKQILSTITAYMATNQSQNQNQNQRQNLTPSGNKIQTIFGISRKLTHSKMYMKFKRMNLIFTVLKTLHLQI